MFSPPGDAPHGRLISIWSAPDPAGSQLLDTRKAPSPKKSQGGQRGRFPTLGASFPLLWASFLREIQQSLVDILFNVVCIIIDHAVSDLANNNSLRLLDFQSRQTSQPQRERKETEEARERFFFSVFSLFLFCVLLNDSLDEA